MLDNNPLQFCGNLVRVLDTAFLDGVAETPDIIKKRVACLIVNSLLLARLAFADAQDAARAGASRLLADIYAVFIAIYASLAAYNLKSFALIFNLNSPRN